MGANVDLSEGEYANIRGCYQYLGVDPLTTQQELFLLTHLRGMSIRAAAKAAGMTPSRAYALMKEDRIETIKEFFRAQLFQHSQITLEMLNNMALEAHRKSANATEEYKGIEVLARLNEIGGFAPQAVIKERQEQSREKDVSPKSQRQLEQLSQDQLIELAGLNGLDGLDPEPVPREQGEDGPASTAEDSRPPLEDRAPLEGEYEAADD